MRLQNVINPIAEYLTFSWVSNMEGDFNENARTELPIPKSNIFMNGFSTYCQQTSLHGWQYIDSENGLCRKIIWFLIINQEYNNYLLFRVLPCLP